MFAVCINIDTMIIMHHAKMHQINAKCKTHQIMHHTQNADKWYRAWGALKSLPSNRGRDKAKKCLYEGVIVPTALYGAGAWGMRSAERRKVSVLEMKCLRSLVGV